MPFNFHHHPPRRKGQREWYENALLLAVAGSIIAVIGQLAGTLIPIMYGPQDSSDFSVVVSPTQLTTIDEGEVYGRVYVNDLHPIIRPYRFGVQLFVNESELPDGLVVKFLNPVMDPGGFSVIDINCTNISAHTHPIVIQGIGGDGRKRRTTLYLNIVKLNSGGLLDSSMNHRTRP